MRRDWNVWLRDGPFLPLLHEPDLSFPIMGNLQAMEAPPFSLLVALPCQVWVETKTDWVVRLWDGAWLEPLFFSTPSHHALLRMGSWHNLGQTEFYDSGTGDIFPSYAQLVQSLPFSLFGLINSAGHTLITPWGPTPLKVCKHPPSRWEQNLINALKHLPQT